MDGKHANGVATIVHLPHIVVVPFIIARIEIETTKPRLVVSKIIEQGPFRPRAILVFVIDVTKLNHQCAVQRIVNLRKLYYGVLVVLGHLGDGACTWLHAKQLQCHIVVGAFGLRECLLGSGRKFRWLPLGATFVVGGHLVADSRSGGQQMRENL